MELMYKDAFKVVGVIVEADLEGLWDKMPPAWKQLLSRHEEIAERVGDTFMDISLREEDGMHKQLVGVEVAAIGDVPEGMVGMEIPRQRYLYHRHLGWVEEIPYTFERMYDWAKENRVPAGSFKIDTGYTLEGGEQEHDLYIRVEG